jgi:GTPase
MSERCGLVALVGRPNVGKSTLLNRLLGLKLSITSRKPQTTRYRILGVATRGPAQLVLVDTPGWQRQPKSALNRQMNRQVRHALSEVDCAVLVIDARGWHGDDTAVYDMLVQAGTPTVLALNKQDLLAEKQALLPRIAAHADAHPCLAYVPLCARTGDGVEALLGELTALLPERAHMFPPDQLTDRSERFLSGEIIREKTMRYLGDELPYRTGVLVDEFAETDDLVRIHATLWVDRDSQKAIVIGKDGSLMKRMASEARRDLETLLGRRVFLQVWVKTKRGWADDPEALQIIGLGD